MSGNMKMHRARTNLSVLALGILLGYGCAKKHGLGDAFAKDAGQDTLSSDDGAVKHDVGPLECAGQDAASGSDPCGTFLGFAWNGLQCRQVLCECVGADCDKLFTSEAECYGAYGSCIAPCASQVTTPGYTCRSGSEWIWDGSTCRVRGSDCARDTFASEVECQSAYAACMPASCEAQDAITTDDGPCYVPLEYKYDGSACGGVCPESCAGADCDKLADTEAECQTAYAACLPLSCEADDAVAEGLCATPLGVRWNGSQCEFFSGCECKGADCGKYEHLLDCWERHGDCWYDARCSEQDAHPLHDGPCNGPDAFAYDGFSCGKVCPGACGGTDCDKLYPTKEACADAVKWCPHCPMDGDEILWPDIGTVRITSEIWRQKCGEIYMPVSGQSDVDEYEAAGFYCAEDVPGQPAHTCYARPGSIYQICKVVAAHTIGNNRAICGYLE